MKFRIYETRVEIDSGVETWTLEECPELAFANEADICAWVAEATDGILRVAVSVEEDLSEKMFAMSHVEGRRPVKENRCSDVRKFSGNYCPH